MMLIYNLGVLAYRFTSKPIGKFILDTRVLTRYSQIVFVVCSLNHSLRVHISVVKRIMWYILSAQMTNSGII